MKKNIQKITLLNFFFIYFLIYTSCFAQNQITVDYIDQKKFSTDYLQLSKIYYDNMAFTGDNFNTREGIVKKQNYLEILNRFQDNAIGKKVINWECTTAGNFGYGHGFPIDLLRNIEDDRKTEYNITFQVICFNNFAIDKNGIARDIEKYNLWLNIPTREQNKKLFYKDRIIFSGTIHRLNMFMINHGELTIKDVSFTFKK